MHFNAWEDYETRPVNCDNCKWTGTLGTCFLDFSESKLITVFRCPECERTIGLCGNEATVEQIKTFANLGSKKAQEFLRDSNFE